MTHDTETITFRMDKDVARELRALRSKQPPSKRKGFIGRFTSIALSRYLAKEEENKKADQAAWQRLHAFLKSDPAIASLPITSECASCGYMSTGSLRTFVDAHNT